MLQLERISLLAARRSAAIPGGPLQPADRSALAQTYISCETRDGIYGERFRRAALADLVRLAVIDDKVEDGSLHLLRLTPLAWCRPDFETRFDDMPTLFGPVGLRFGLSRDSRTLNVSFEPSWRNRPQSVFLNVPPLEGLERVVVNGRAMRARPGET